MVEEQRVLFQRIGEQPGPTLVIVGGIHGNEPAGVRAARRVLAELAAIFTRGEVIALAGNMRALRENCRHVARDLNRQWSPARLAAPGAADVEALELEELRAALDAAIARARGPIYFLDLHTTSAAGIAFALSRDASAERAFAAHFPLPVILGLVEQVEGVVAEYMAVRGCITLSVEGGQHQATETQANLEAVVRIAIWASGLVPREDVHGLGDALATLERGRGDLPLRIQVLSRHAITAADQFSMEPGFANICRVTANMLLARDRRGEIRAPRDGLVLLPLYQPLGEDGFFFGCELR